MTVTRFHKTISVMLAAFLLLLSFAPCGIIKLSAGAEPDSMLMDFENHESIADMVTGSLVKYKNKSGVSEYSVNTDPLYSQDSNHSLKLSFYQTASGDYDGMFRILLKDAITEADGISFWIYNPGSLIVNSFVFAGLSTNSAVRYKYYGITSVAFSPNMSGFQKVTLRFDGFGLRATNDGGAIVANTAPTKDTIASFDYLEFRVYSTKANQSIYLDSFEWLYDRDIETFDDSNDLPSNVTVQGYQNQTASDFCTYSIVESDKDSGKALKVDFGTVDGETVETNSDLSSAYRYIQVSIDTEGLNLNGSALRLWLKNASAADVGVRVRITDAQGVQHRHKSGSYRIAPAAGNVNNVAIQSDYSIYKEYGPIFNYVDESKPVSLITDSQLQNAQKVELFIFPRTVNNGGSMIIDGISVANPKEKVTDGSGDFGGAVVSSTLGISGLTKSTDPTGTVFQLTDCDFYAAGSYIYVPLAANINTSEDAYLVFEAKVPRTTKLKLSLLDGTNAVLGTAYVGLIPDAGGNLVRVKVPVSDFGITSSEANVEGLKIEVADGFKNSYNFLKIGESVTYNNLKLVNADPGADVKQNKDVTPAAIPASEVIGTFDLPSSTATKDSGTLYLSKLNSSDSLSLQLNGIDFYQVKNYLSLRLNPDSTFWSYKDTAYVVFEVKVPRDTKLNYEIYDSAWRAASGLVGVKSAGNNYVKVKIPLYDLFSKKPGMDYSTPKQIRITVANDFKNSVNFLNVGESVHFKNMVIVKDDPGTEIMQNKTISPVPVPTENIVKSVAAGDVSVVTGSGSLYLEKTNGDGDINLKLTNTAFYSSTNRIKLSVDSSVLRSNMENGYFVFDAKSPRNTKLNLVFSNAAGDIQARALVGIVDATGGFVTFKAPLKDLLLDANLNMSALTNMYLELDSEFRKEFNFLKKDEIISFKNMRFIENDSFATVKQNKDITPLLSAPKTPEEIEAEETRLIFQEKSPSCDAKNNAATANLVSLSSISLSRKDADYEFFGKYTKFTVNDDAYYQSSYPLILSNTVADLDARNMSYYLNTATVRFWARVEKNMTVDVVITNKDYQGVKVPVQLTKAVDDRFTEYVIAFKDIYASLLAANPSFKFDFTNISQVRVAANVKTPEAFLAKGESICIASMEIWSKESVVYNRLESLSFHYEGEDISVDGYDGSLPKDAVVKVKNVPFSEAELWNLNFGQGTEIVMFKTISLYSADNTRIDPSARIWLSFKIPAGVDVRELGLYQVFFDGYSERLQYVIEGDMVSVHSYSVGSFVLVNGVPQQTIGGDSPLPSDPSDPGNDDVNTGESYVFVWGFVVMAVSGGVLVYSKSKKKQHS